MTDVPVNFRDYDPTINPTNTIEPYNAMLERDVNIPQRPSLEEEYAEKRPKNATVPKAIFKAMGEYAKLINHTRELERKTAELQAQYLSILKQQSELSSLQTQMDLPTQAWCADTASLPKDRTVATMEVPGEVNPSIGGGLNIAPGFSTGSVWATRYGQIQFGPAMSPEGFAWNLTMLTPWMKWMPLWRYAIVTAVNGAENTLDVLLAPIVSKVNSYLYKDSTINTPWDSSMTGVEVEYMSCGALAFEPGDNVIVEFRSELVGGLEYYVPYVIGFQDHPQACRGFLCVKPDGTHFVRNGQASGVVSNPQAGNIDWQGTLGAMSWWGPWGRYPYSNTVSGFAYYPYLYRDNQYLATTPSEVLGTALAEYDGTIYINLICTNGAGVNAYQAPAGVYPLSFTLVGSTSLYYDGSGSYWTCWFFNASGTQAKTIYLADRTEGDRGLYSAHFSLGSASFSAGSITPGRRGDELRGYYYAVDWVGDQDILMTANSDDLLTQFFIDGSVVTPMARIGLLWADLRQSLLLYTLSDTFEYRLHTASGTQSLHTGGGAITSVSGSSIQSDPQEYLVTAKFGSTVVIAGNLSTSVLSGSPHVIRVV